MQTAVWPGGAATLLEMRLPMRDVPTVGFSAHVPHYLSDVEYVPAAVGLIDAAAVATGLSLPVPELRSRADEQLREIAAAVADSPEQAKAIAERESMYDDDASRDVSVGAPWQWPIDASMPNADELVAELEQYLGEQY